MIVQSYGNAIIVAEGLQLIGPYWVLRAFYTVGEKGKGIQSCHTFQMAVM
jgi:hypothetical protein